MNDVTQAVELEDIDLFGDAEAVEEATVAAPPPVVPAGGVLYKVDSSRSGFGEMWRDMRSPSVVIAWVTKLMRVRLPGTVNEPNVESLAPFAVEYADLPADVRERFEPKLRELRAFGFDAAAPQAWRVVDLFNNSRTSIAALGRDDGRAVARLHYRAEGTGNPPKIHCFCDLLSEFAGGRFVQTSGARATLKPAPGVAAGGEVDANPSRLWAIHQETLAADPQANAGGDAAGLLDRYHAVVRDRLLQRGVFKPMRDLDRESAAAVDDAYGRADAATADVVVEMQRLQSVRRGWLSNAMGLLFTLGLFLLIGLPGAGEEFKRWDTLAILVGVLFVHELGHYLAMLAFGYGNVRMFFIPLLGAAVSGRGHGAAGWKKVVVALAGPLPGILAGGVLGGLGLYYHKPLLLQIAEMSLLLNGFNLLPVLPLDGGRVVQSLLFCRHWLLDVGFRVAAAAVLVVGGAFLQTKILLFLGIFLLVGVPAAVRMGRVARRLRREGFVPPTAERGHKVSPELARPVVVGVAGAFPKKRPGNKALAQHALSVYETLCARPPGWLASIGFGVLHAGAFAASLAMLIALMILPGGRWHDFAVAAARQPRRAVTPAQVVAAEPADDAAPLGLTVVANFADAAAARSAHRRLSPQVGDGESITLFGQTLMVSLPAATRPRVLPQAAPAVDDAARRRWLDALASVSDDVFVIRPGNFGAGMSLMFIAQNEAEAADVQAELEEYLQVPAATDLVPPWSAEAAELWPRWPEMRRARRTLLTARTAGNARWDDPRLTDLNEQMARANRRGDAETVAALAVKQQQLIRDIQRTGVTDLKADASLDAEVADRYLELLDAAAEFDRAHQQDAEATDDDEAAEFPLPPLYDLQSPAWRTLAARMGTMPEDAAARRRLAPATGGVSRAGLLVTLHWLQFDDPARGAPALVRWLDSRGATALKYDFDAGFFGDDD